MRLRIILKSAAAFITLYIFGLLIAPHIRADSYGQRLRGSLERALGRRVEVQGPVRFSLLRGPSLTAEDVVIHEDPSIGFEPAAYIGSVSVRPDLWALLGGKFVIASILLEAGPEGSPPTLNLAKSGDSWNFASFINRSVMSTAPAIHVRNGRVNFKFGDTKSIFYLMNADLDITPPSSLRGAWLVSCKAEAARTDRPALGLGSFAIGGKWFVGPERVDLQLRLDRAQLGELAVLISGQAGGVHAVVSSRLRLAGPLNGIGILGRLNVEDVHRWDLLPTKGQGWLMDLRGRLDLVAQQLELQSTSAAVPVTTRFRAANYLSRPRWGATFTWNRFPIGPVLQLAADLGAPLPPKLRINGSIDGAIGFSNPGGWQGELVLHDTAVTIPDSQAVRFEQMHLLAGKGKLWLAPAVLRTADDEEARLEATYSMDDDSLELSLSSGGMKVSNLRAQAALAAVPWLEQFSSGRWSGQLWYHRPPSPVGQAFSPVNSRPRDFWTGALKLDDAQIAVPGLAHPLTIASARVGIDGHRLAVEKLAAQAGEIAFTGDYRYEPGTLHPHRLRVRAGHITAADLEAELMPTLRRGSSLLARALGRSNIPDWLRQRRLEGSVQIADIEFPGTHLENFRARMVWDVNEFDLAGIDARTGGARVAGTLNVILGGQAPSYKLTATVRGLNWQAGQMDIEGAVQTSGVGPRLLANLKSEGTFSGMGLDFGTLAGGYSVSWTSTAARLTLSDLSLRTEDGIFVGRGATQDDGRLLIVLSNGAKEMRMTGTLAALKLDDPHVNTTP
jgi:hypothetical protein